MKRSLLSSRAFVRSARRWSRRHPDLVDRLEAVLAAMEADVHAPVLKTHKLQGKLAGSWACSAGYDVRVVFQFVRLDGREAILLQAVGTHDEVY